MPRKTYFTPGPSELYPSVARHIAFAIDQHICSISHRSKQFEAIYEHAENGLRTLLNIPAGYHLFFLSSANEIWERILQNCVEKISFHLVNGSFSRKFYEIAQELGKDPALFEVPFGKGFTVSKIEVPENAEAICVTHNETSSGVMMPAEDMYALAAKKPEALLFIDAVSSLPYPDFDFTKTDSVYCSVQKCFGMPAGLGLWIVSPRCLEKAQKLLAKGNSIGSYHSLPSLLEKANQHQNPETPNVLAIYVLGKVLAEMNEKGAATLRKETEQKASLIYDYLATSTILAPAVQEIAHRSVTTIVANTSIPASEINKRLLPYEMVVGSGYGKHKETQIRIANFPAHSVEQVQKLISVLKEVLK